MQWIYYLIVPFVISLCITPLIKFIAIKLGVYAEMNERTIHKKPMARIGGVAIYVAFLLGMTIFMKLDASLKGILLGGTIMFFSGLIDDMIDLKPKYKLMFQALAAIVVMQVGSVYLGAIHLPFGISISMGIISYAITFVWLVGITNAVNLIDGLDGLAAGISAIVLIVIASLSVIDGRVDICNLSLLLAGATLGFLIFNTHPAKLFMGDCGALFLGFMIASISLMGFKSSTFITLGLPILMLGVPIFDTLAAIVRRKLSGHKFSDADKNHLHHVLMRRFGHRNTVLILYAVTALFGVVAYLYILNKPLGVISLIILAIAVELFMEFSHMIANQYHPIISLLCLILHKDHIADIKAPHLETVTEHCDEPITPEILIEEQNKRKTLELNDNDNTTKIKVISEINEDIKVIENIEDLKNIK
ncbi:MAG: MraY family glycosyltransferase [Erysipelotrichaceae bacterium]